MRPFPDDGRSEVRISNSGGRLPLWLPNGRELLYRTDDQRLMVAPYSVKDGSFVSERPRPWTERTLADTGVISYFDFDAAGGRALGLMPTSTRHQQSPNHVTIKLNAASEVRRLLAAASGTP